MTVTDEEEGEIAYRAWREAMRGRDREGREVPPWWQLTPELRADWARTAAGSLAHAARFGAGPRQPPPGDGTLTG